MLDKFVYEDHLGRRFIGIDAGVFLNYSDLRDYAWSYDTINSRISRFYRPVTSRKIPLVVYCDSDADAIKTKNRLLELAETDIVAKLPGKVYIDDYYTTGYITASKKSEYLLNRRLCKLDLTLTSDDPAWYREQKHIFLPGSNNTVGVGGGTDYAYDYPYDYALALQGRRIMCDSISSNLFRMTIYGVASNPAIVIGGHTYAINGEIGAGEVLQIDGLNKTITLTTAGGRTENWFDKRGRVHYIFEPIPAGQNTISWPGTFGFDLTVIERRSEPRWT